MSERELLWAPSPERIAAATLTRYQRWLADECGVRADGYEELWRWSISNLEEFWDSIVRFFGVRFSAAPAEVLASRPMPGAEWFPGARLNYAEHMFRGRPGGQVAIEHASEVRGLGSGWTWERLGRETAQIAAGLRARGIGPGDRVVAYMPNIPETVAAFLACASIGAIWSAAAPEFGARAVIDRFSQIEPKLMLAVDGYRYGGKDFDRRETAGQIAAELPSGPELVFFGYRDRAGWQPGFRGDDPAEPLRFEQVPFEHPLWVLYSSGTTGLPKPIVHGQGGILLEQLKLSHLHLDAQPGERFFWFSTTGWMMWNLLVGVLLTDSPIVLFDGNPGYPNMECLWDLAEQTRISCFGTSAAFIASCMKAGVKPRAGRDLGALRSVGSTGSPLSPEGFRWVYDEVGRDTWLFSTSGGTDLCTAFVGGVPTLPVRLGELQARALGAALEAFDEDGNSVTDQVGELVLTAPMPSMPIFLWGDESGERYRDSYFATYPGIWRHGDWIELTRQGGAVIYGRSDSTINRGGVRMGTSEIYRSVLSLDDIVDALVVDLPREGTDGWMQLFVVLRAGRQLTDELTAQVRGKLRTDCSPRHVPDQVVQIAEVPRTLSGKLLEVPVKRILMGTPPERAASRESLANPASLDQFVAMAANRSVRGGLA